MTSIGMNVSADGRHDGASLRAMNCTWARIVHRRDLDVSARLAEYRFRGISVLLCFDRTSVETYPSAADAFADALRHYGQYVAAWEIGNEPDQDSPSSWTMPVEDLVAMGKTARICLPDRLIVCGGLASGQPSYLVGQDISWCDAIGVHPYLKDATPGNDLPDVDVLVSDYAALGKQVWVTEWGWWGDDEQRGKQEVDDMIGWAAKTSTIGLFLHFCADDAMVAPFGLVRADGSLKPAYGAFVKQAANAVPVPLPIPGQVPAPVPDPLPVPTPEPALAADQAALMDIWQAVRSDVPFNPDAAFCRYWLDHIADMGSPVGPEHVADDGSVWQGYTRGRFKWAGGDEVIAA